MTTMTAADARQLAPLRVALGYCARRPAVQALIDKLLAPATEAPEYPEERSGTAREAPSTGMRDGTAAPAVQTPAPASVGVQAAAPHPSAAPQPALAAGERSCPRCRRGFAPTHRLQRYCGPECQQHRKRAYHKRDEAYTLRTKLRRAERAAATRDAAAETRREPARPRWRLGWRKDVVIRPARPAPIARYATATEWLIRCRYGGPDIVLQLPAGSPCLFQDDLDALADHGSPRSAMPAPVFGHLPTVSPLGALYSP